MKQRHKIVSYLTNEPICRITTCGHTRCDAARMNQSNAYLTSRVERLAIEVNELNQVLHKQLIHKKLVVGCRRCSC